MKVLVDQEKEKEDKYLVHCCHELRKDFTPVVYSVDGMSWREARMAENRMVSYLSKKWHQPYSQMVPYMRLRILLSIARSNMLLIRGSRDHETARPFIQSGSTINKT